MADATDSKSVIGDYVWVQVPSPVPTKSLICLFDKWDFLNDVCLRQIMLAAPMMFPSEMM